MAVNYVDLIVSAIKDKLGVLTDKDKQRIKDSLESDSKKTDGQPTYEIDPNNPPNQWGTLFASGLGLQGDPTKLAEQYKNYAFLGLLIVGGVLLLNFLFKE